MGSIRAVFGVVILSGVILSGCGREEQAVVQQRLFAATPDVYEGVDGRRKCTLTVHKEWYENGTTKREDYRAEVSTDYSHGSDKAGNKTLVFTVDGAGKILEWADKKTGEFLRLALSQPADKIENASSFRLKWLHGSHHHDNTCKNLKKVAKP